MSSFYKMDPADWDFGTADLSLEEEAAYLRIVNSINKHDAPVPNVDRVLAGMFRCSTRKARALRDALVAAGKIYLEDGRIWNDRARFEVNSRSVRSKKCAESGAKGGRMSAELRSKPLTNNEPAQATASSRIEEKRIDSPPTPPKGEKRATRLADDWRLTDRLLAYAIEKGLTEREAETEAEKFKNYWQAKSGAGARKHDWDKTWMNWAINAAERKPRRRDEPTGDYLKQRGFPDLEERARNSDGGRDNRPPPRRDAADDVSGMLTHSTQEGGPVPFRDVQAGRDSLALLALWT